MDTEPPQACATPTPRVPLRTLGLRFLALGASAFGGPVAHLGVLRESCVVRHRWLSEHAFADLVALAQLLPGPTSSQTVFGIGLWQRGVAGGIVSSVCFALPGAVLLCTAGLLMIREPGIAQSAWARGLMAFATAVVAIAVHGMVRRLTHGNVKGCIAAGSFLLCAAWDDPLTGAACVGIGLAAGALLCPRRHVEAADTARQPRPSHWMMTVLALLLVAIVIVLPFMPGVTSLPDSVRLPLALAQSGSMVFGGGHVVLPMMQASVVEEGLMDPNPFLSGYSLTQAIPGPLFNVGAFIGASRDGVMGAVACTIALFLPGMCLMGAALPMWSQLRQSCRARRALDGANAAVTGVLLWALVFVLIPEAIGPSVPLALVALGALGLLWHRTPLPLVAATAAAVGMLVGCQHVSGTDRSQFNVLSVATECELGDEAYAEATAQAAIVRDGADAERVQRVAARIFESARRRHPEIARRFAWQIVLVKDDATINAWALPGGKCAVYTGMLLAAPSDDALAAVLGHEAAHAIARHGGERISQSVAGSVIADAVTESAGLSAGQQQLLDAAHGMGGLAFSRSQESEADELGLLIAADAGFDPRAAITFWEAMSQRDRGGRPPEFLSTHPSERTRIERLQRLMPRALRIREQPLARQVAQAPQAGVSP